MIVEVREEEIPLSPAVSVEAGLYAAGYCRHPEFLTLRGGSVKPVPFPAGFACIRHPEHGYMLFDTGYSARFFEETRRLPDYLYRLVTPVTFREEDSAVHQLRRQGIHAEDIRYVVLSHFHADHIAGLRDFPGAKLICKREAYVAVHKLGSFAAVKAGYLRGLLPTDFEQRSSYVEETSMRRLPEGFPFPTGYDLLGDGSIIAIDVPGHAAGQIGLWLLTGEGELFLCADAAWSSRAIAENRRPHPAAGLIMNDRRSYGDSFERLLRLHKNYPNIRIVPSHCSKSLRSQADQAKPRRET
ncbi:MBL fold metallo-hydrolase [Paenibacillus sp. HB172176]|uniref:MBL fold metallo-hydrolase n=1 Tax=Paenibacillus sp. HB172176 TaxID=2493690 RepID=UPI00143C0B58|nr:MBL fold metallo-hydrolase [Paenibacillus sp. HB172176]